MAIETSVPTLSAVDQHPVQAKDSSPRNTPPIAAEESSRGGDHSVPWTLEDAGLIITKVVSRYVEYGACMAMITSPQRSRERDVVSLYLPCSNEEWGGKLWILDGTSDEFHSIDRVVSGSVTPDGRGVVFAREKLLFWDVPRRFHKATVGRQQWYSESEVLPEEDPCNLSVKEVEAANNGRASLPWEVIKPISYQRCGGQNFVSKPYYLNLETNKEQMLPLWGGATIINDGQRVIGLMKYPRENLGGETSVALAHHLEMNPWRWRLLEGPEEVQARAVLLRKTPEDKTYWNLYQDQGDAIIVTTANRRLGIIYSGLEVIAARLAPMVKTLADDATNAKADAPLLPQEMSGALDERISAVEALEMLKEAAGQLPEGERRPVARIANTKGLRLFKRGKRRDALLLFIFAANNDKSYGMPRYNAARIYAQEGELTEAMKYLGELEALGPLQKRRLLETRRDVSFKKLWDRPEFQVLFKKAH